MEITRQVQGVPGERTPIDDPRWQVVERIIASPSFQKSERLKAFLTYVVLQFLAGHPEKLSGHQIGIAVFGKDDSYDQAEDNTVRTHARQLRLRLLEYFDTFGRDEPLILEIPKGSYIPSFRPANLPAPPLVPAAPATQILELAPAPAAPARSSKSTLFAWSLVAILLAILVPSLFRKDTPVNSGINAATPAWPFAALAVSGQPTSIVMSDNSFALYQVAAHRRFHLNDYLKADYPANLISYIKDGNSPALFDLTDQLGRKQLTSFADSAIVGALARARSSIAWSVRPGRDIKAREIQDGNYLLLGSSYSNPWVELYENRLNFIMAPDTPLRMINRNPVAGELPSYLVQGVTGVSGDDYAAIALIPNEKHGAVMIIQGTKEEGTEAAGLFISDPNACLTLRDRLGLKSSDSDRTWFEVLLKTRTLAGASTSTEIVAVRRFPSGK